MNSENLPENLSDAHQRIIALQRENHFLKEKMALMQRELFGRSSERRIPEVSSQQMSLFAAKAEEPRSEPKKEVITYERNKPGRRRNAETGVVFPEHLEREVVLLEGEKPQGECTVEWTKVSEHLCCRPTQFFVKQYQRPVYKTPEGQVIATPAPETVFERAMVDRTFLAWVFVAKFCWHLPLNRQEQMLKAQGISLSRDTLVNYVLRGAELLLPVYKELLQTILESGHIFADESPVTVGKYKAGRKQYREAYFWPLLAENNIAFLYSPTRAAINLQKVLGDYQGYIQCDGYRAYEKIAKESPEIVLVGCWAHARRKFIDAENSDPVRVAKALKFIRLLYRVERYAKENQLSPPKLLWWRQRWSARILKAFKLYLQQLMAEPDVLPKSLLCKACSYALTRWAALAEYTLNPELQIDSNAIERQIRPVTLGRKNWLFCASEVGAEAAALFYSLIGSCKLNDIDPWLYLADLLLRISEPKCTDARNLLPANWKTLYEADARTVLLKSPTVN